MKKSSFNWMLVWDTLLVVSVFLCAFIIPVFPPSWGRSYIRIGFTLIFISGALITRKRSLLILYLAFAAFLMEWISVVFDFDFVTDISRILNVVFFIIVIISLFREMATAKVVTARIMLFSISGYILMGIIFSVLIVAIIQRDPHAFNLATTPGDQNNVATHLSESMYFGFVTLASLGYGDILPLKPYTRSLATLITITGQLYIATVIGLMIGKYVSSKDKAEIEKRDNKNSDKTTG